MGIRSDRGRGRRRGRHPLLRRTRQRRADGAALPGARRVGGSRESAATGAFGRHGSARRRDRSRPDPDRRPRRRAPGTRGRGPATGCGHVPRPPGGEIAGERSVIGGGSSSRRSRSGRQLGGYLVLPARPAFPVTRVGAMTERYRRHSGGDLRGRDSAPARGRSTRRRAPRSWSSSWSWSWSPRSPSTGGATAAPRGSARPEAAPATTAATTTSAPPSTAPVRAAPVVTRTGAGATVTLSIPFLLTLRTNAPSWVQITDAPGHTLFATTLASGAEQQVPGSEPIVVALGNATAVTMTVDGTPLDLSGLPATGSVTFRRA